jgi:hypothetical protein
MPRPDTTRSLLLVALLVAEVGLALARVRTDRSAPFSGRFSWSMFGGPITGRCHHSLTATDALGHPIAVPLPRDNPALRALLLADVPTRFAAVVPWFAPYADDDAEVARSLDDVLGRYHRAGAPTLSLTSQLRCDSPGTRPFSRTTRWTAR